MGPDSSHWVPCQLLKPVSILVIRVLLTLTLRFLQTSHFPSRVISTELFLVSGSYCPIRSCLWRSDMQEREAAAVSENVGVVKLYSKRPIIASLDL